MVDLLKFPELDRHLMASLRKYNDLKYCHLLICMLPDRRDVLSTLLSVGDLRPDLDHFENLRNIFCCMALLKGVWELDHVTCVF
jgi:hypothetical protein